MCRELTKIHEETVRGSLSELAAHYAEPPRGECVIVLSGAEETAAETPSLEAQLAAMEARIASGEKPRAAAKAVANGLSPTELYNACLLYTSRCV